MGQSPEVGPTASDGRPASDRRPAVEAVGIVKRFGSTLAVDDVSLTVWPGETHALVGRNGAGKSTRRVDADRPRRAGRGTIAFSGEPAPSLGDREAWRRHVACVYQKSTIIPALTAVENLYLNRQTSKGVIRWAAGAPRRARLLAEWELDIDVRRPAGELSVEDRQMIEIARALSFGARFVILDEPTAQLDGARSSACSGASGGCRSRASRSCTSAITSRRSTRSATRSRFCATPGIS